MRRPAVLAAALLGLGLLGIFGLTRLMHSAAERSDESMATPVRAQAGSPSFPADLCVLMPSEPYSMPILERELVRQAVLLAAREELGLRTRDGGLREVGAPADPGAEQSISVRWFRDGRLVVGLSRANFGAPPSPPSFPPPASGDGLPQLARRAEALSRGELPGLLKQLGFEEQTTPPGRPPKAADPPAELTGPLDLVSQFAAARAWHAALRAAGESSRRLGGLVLAYANLGLLTEHHWSAEPKVFHARSLLYAERLLNRTGETAASLRVRAYARALAGLPAAAAEDLARAEELGGDEPVPGWVAVLDARCRGDAETLDRLCDSRDRHDRAFSRLVRLSLAETSGITLSVQQAALAVIEAEPSCARGLAALLGSAMPLGTTRSAQETAFDAAIAWLYEPLTRSRLPLPIDVSVVRKNPGREGEFREKLLTELAGDERYFADDGEPSLTAFGGTLEEEGFYQAWRVVSIDRDSLGVSADDLIRRTRPWAPRHLFWGFVEAHSWDDNTASKQLRDLRTVAAREDLLPALWPLRERIAVTVGWDERQDRKLKKCCDEVAADLAWRIDHADDRAEGRGLARRLEQVDPESAATAARLVRYDSVRTADRLAEWERLFPHDPAFLRAAADWYVERERYDDATRCLRAALRMVPEYGDFKKLADVRLAARDEDGFVSVLEEVTRNPSFGLEDASAAAEIAGYLMRRGRWREALPWADRAADSGSGWGLARAAECREGLGDYDGAEALYRAIGERYRDSEGDWYLWCLRTGRGDLAAAREAAEPALERWKEFPGSYDYAFLRKLALVDYVEGRREESLDRRQEAFRWTSEGYDALLAAITADELGLADVRDDYLRRAIGTQEYVPTALARAMLDDVGGSRLQPDSVAQAAYRGLGGPGIATNVQYLLGRFLETHDRPDEADAWYGLAAASPRTDNYCCLLASVALRRRGRDIPPQRLDEVDGPTTEALPLFAEAGSYMQQQRLIAARLRLDRGLALLPGHVGALRLRSQTLLQSGRTEEALADIEAALALQPDNEGLLGWRATVLDCAGRHAEAIEEYESLLPLAETEAEENDVRQSLCGTYAACEDAAFRDPAKALRHAQAMHAAGSNRNWVNKSRMEAVALAAGGDFAAAVKAAEGALEEAPDSLRSRLEYQLACYRAGKAYISPARWWMLFDASDAAEEALGPAAMNSAPPVEARKPSKP